jgi:hypothetical protein
MDDTATDLLRYHLISQYRELISRRYDELIAHRGDTLPYLSDEVAHQIKDFFLSNIYPPPDRRRELDAAFAELRNFTHHPALIWGLLGSLPKAIFRFGTHLPAAIHAGLKSLEAYTSAIGFEEAMLDAAQRNSFSPPLTEAQFTDCIRAIPRSSLDHFIYEAIILFTVISDTDLLSRTITIMHDVISRMTKKPDTYSSDQIAAIELGLELMQQGYELLAPLTQDTKQDIISFITQSERNFLAEIHPE